MKKCYIIPNVNVTSVEIASMVCTSPSDIYNDGRTTAPDPDDEDYSGEVDARQRGGDFGSLW